MAEFALVLPLLFFLAMLVTEGASFVRVHQVINNAAREGARISSLPENSPNNGDHTAGIKAAVATYACTNGVALSGFTCATANPLAVCTTSSVVINQALAIPTAAGPTIPGSKATVTCSFHLKYLSALPTFGIIPANLPLTGNAEFPNQ